MKHLRTYGLYDEKDNGLLVFMGTLQEIAGFLGITDHAVYCVVRHRRPLKRRYSVEPIDDEKEEEKW